MKLIHLSDLHIGKRVNEISMIDEQEYILTQIIRIIDGALKKAVYEKKAVVTAEALKQFIAQQNIAVGRREFGYAGGVFHEKY